MLAITWPWLLPLNFLLRNSLICSEPTVLSSFLITVGFVIGCTIETVGFSFLFFGRNIFH